MVGAVPLTPSHEIGWLALVGSRGKKVAASDHATPVTNITRFSDFIAVQGDGRNLSVYDMNLEPLWDHDSPVTDVVLLSGDFAGGDAEDLAVVGTRTFRVGAADADSIRNYLDVPEFMVGATRTNGLYEFPRSFITFYVSNEERLVGIVADDSEADAFASGELGQAVDHATTARAAAAVLGRREEVARLSSRIHEYASYAGRRRSLLLAAFVLAALGVWVTFDCLKGGVAVGVSMILALLLFATAAAVSRILGATGLNPLLLVGGAAATICAARVQLRPRAVRRRVPGAAIEDLIRALMEFLHGAGEGVPSDGVVDAARKSVTKVSYLAQEMMDSLDDTERYAMLKGRLRSRGDDFLDTTYPRVAVVLSLAERARFVVHEAERMARAADRMRAAVTTILSDPPPELPILKQQLQAIKEGRDQLATAADRAWAIVQTNPGCSLRRSIDRILEEKLEELAEADVRVSHTRGVPAERDAVALWSFEFRFLLENLVTNAIRAMRSSKERVLSIETATAGTMCSVRISDTGIGMDETIAGELFEAKGDERNGGFGMPNSRLRLRECGGDIVLERTASGEGTTFLLTIPHWTPNTGESDA
jgi:signal transduction histidine kinase